MQSWRAQFRKHCGVECLSAVMESAIPKALCSFALSCMESLLCREFDRYWSQRLVVDAPTVDEAMLVCDEFRRRWVIVHW